MAAKGGKRPGAGRPKGSTNKPQIRDYLTPREITDLVKEWKKRAEKSDRIFVALVEQIFGKAPQAIDHTTLGEKIQSASITALSNEELIAIAEGGAE